MTTTRESDSPGSARDPDLALYRSGRGFQVNRGHWKMLSGCHVGSHGMSLYNGAAPAEARVPRGAFNDRSYYQTWTQAIALGRSASGTITITVKRMSQRTARRRIRDFRARPRNHPV